MWVACDPLTLLDREGHSTFGEPGNTRVEKQGRQKEWPLREKRVSGSTVSFIIQYLFKEDVDGRS